MESSERILAEPRQAAHMAAQNRATLRAAIAARIDSANP
jgi:hypothetical protein